MSNVNTGESNEQLALSAQDGDRDALHRLWQQTYPLVYKLLTRYYPLCTRCGIEPDDLRQSGYFALLRAVEAYDPARRFMFNSYLRFHVGNAAREALGFTDRRTKLPASLLSLDAPISEDDSATLGDTLADPYADFTDTVTEREAHRQNAAALRKEAERLPDKHRQALLSTLWEQRTLADTAAGMGVSLERVRQLRNQGIRKLRSTRTARSIEREYMNRHVSLSRFRVDHTSEQERYLLWLEEWEEGYAKNTVKT